MTCLQKQWKLVHPWLRSIKRGDSSVSKGLGVVVFKEKSEIGTPLGVRLYEVEYRETVIAPYVNNCAQSVVSTRL